MIIDTVFRSGMSRANDFRGARDAGVPIGVVAGELTGHQVLMVIPNFLQAGGQLFIDSGAFSCWLSHEQMDWPPVMHTYRMIAETTNAPENLYVVAPDVVGDQAATLELLVVWKEKVRELIDLGCNVIIPLQVGNLPAPQMLARAADLLGTSRFVAGIPSNRAALSIEECATLSHHAFHILGRVQTNEDQIARVAALRHLNPAATVTADANWIRSRLGKISPLANSIREENRVQGTDWRSRLSQTHHRAAAISRLIAADTWGEDPAGEERVATPRAKAARH